ncbi:Ig-like domain-containing protein [Aquiflexum sp.]|uniref:Ig-like domain-containing protein n=1 Tax=Aquiflexum sp. TaxID=1872584 RepID=UPI003593B7F2
MINKKTTVPKMENFKWYFPFFILCSFILLIAACTENFVNDDDMSNDIEILANSLSLNHGKIGISDAANDGIDEFYFLAPTVGKTPKYNGRFHPNLQPVVEISDDFNFENVLATFRRGGNGTNLIAVNESEEFYSATWNTSELKAVLGKIYRIRVKVGSRVLGFVDVGIVPAKTKPLNSGIIPLVQNQSFKIDFRIEDKICPARIEVLPEEATVLIDGEQQFTAIVYNFYDEVLENQKISWFVGNSSVASINQNGLAKGLQFGFSPIKAQVQDVIGTASLFVQEVADDAPRPGRDVVVFNDINIFDDVAMRNPNNVLLVKNFLNYDAPGIRSSGKKVWFDCGRNAVGGNSFTPCTTGTGNYTFIPFRNAITGEGFAIESVFSSPGSLINIPSDVKILFLYMPTVAFTLGEINELKKFGEEGGRIVFVGEHSTFYGSTGIQVENQFLINMGAVMRNVGQAVDCLDDDGLHPILPASSLRPHPITRDMTNLTVACASVIELGPNDFPLFYNIANNLVLGGVAQIDTAPISELKSARINTIDKSIREIRSLDPARY